MQTPTPLQLSFRALTAALAVAVLASCSGVDSGAMDIAYEHADWLLQRMSARYVDLDDSQKKALRTRLSRLHAWHRTQELPLYADLLDQTADRINQHLGPADMAWMAHSIHERRRAGAVAVAQELAPLLLTLTQAQEAQIAEAMARDNAHFAKTQLGPDPAARSKERTQWLSGQVERWTGKLTHDQREGIGRLASSTPDFPAARLAERRRWQASLLQLIRQPHDEAALRSGLADLLATPRAGANDAYKHAVAHYEEELNRMILDLDRSLTPSQRATAVERLHHFAAHLRELAAKPA